MARPSPRRTGVSIENWAALRWSSQHFLNRVEGVVVMAGRMSVAEKLEIWRLLRAGTSFRVIGRQLGRSDASIQQYVGLTGGVRPRERTRAANRL